MDLAKIGEVQHLFFPIDHQDAVNSVVNEWLAKGYVILTIKVIERRYNEWKQTTGKWYPVVSSTLVYVLGKPRGKPVPTRRVTEESSGFNAIPDARGQHDPIE